VALPVLLCLTFGVSVLILTNASGGIRSDLKPGDLLVIDDHINLMGVSPLVGKHEACWGPRFPDQSEVYDRQLRAAMDAAGARAGLKLPHGVYAATSGPAYETPAEVVALRTLGADAVGMSTVPEAMLAHAAGLRVAAISCVANLAAGLSTASLSHEDILAETRRNQEKMAALLVELLKDSAVRSPPQ
jgi:purine-nucleoside phosphorylase